LCMARRTYRVVLEVLSNMDGDPPEGTEEKLIKEYLEGINGVGSIEVHDVCRAAPEAMLPPPPTPSEEEIHTTIPSPPPLWAEEAPTKTRKRKRGGVK
jgi:hypothetical protein